MKDDIYKKHLLLIGGGHAHVMALKMLAMAGVPGVRITLISSSVLTPYSGMLPGLIAGHYQYDEVHIDLARLCRALNVRFIEDTVVSLDLDRQRVVCQQHPDFRYDVLSIDTGSTPDVESVPGAAQYTHAVKPVDRFLRFWLGLQARLQSMPGREALSVALVGAGASGVEVALAMQHRLHIVAPKASVAFHIVSATPEILPSHPPKVRSRYQKVLDKRAIQVHQNFGLPVSRQLAFMMNPIRVTSNNLPVMKSSGRFPQRRRIGRRVPVWCARRKALFRSMPVCRVSPMPMSSP